MPELPEVETTRRGVAPAIAGRRVVAVHVYDRRLRWPVPAGLEAALEGCTVAAVERRSKYLLFRMTKRGAMATLIVHFGMTGSLRVYQRAPAPKKHDHVDIVFDHRITLRYRDPRRFGTLLWEKGDASGHPLLAGLGAEPFSDDFTPEALHRGTRGRRVAIKQALMDNRLVVGVGNIYASEALFRAGIRPTRAAGRLSLARLTALVDAVRATLAAAIDGRGSTLRDYVDSRGEPGDAQRGHYVYGRYGAPCRVCGTAIRAIRQGQRSTYYCPRCQT